MTKDRKKIYLNPRADRADRRYAAFQGAVHCRGGAALRSLAPPPRFGRIAVSARRACGAKPRRRGTGRSPSRRAHRSERAGPAMRRNASRRARRGSCSAVVTTERVARCPGGTGSPPGSDPAGGHRAVHRYAAFQGVHRRGGAALQSLASAPLAPVGSRIGETWVRSGGPTQGDRKVPQSAIRRAGHGWCGGAVARQGRGTRLGSSGTRPPERPVIRRAERPCGRNGCFWEPARCSSRGVPGGSGATTHGRSGSKPSRKSSQITTRAQDVQDVAFAIDQRRPALRGTTPGRGLA